MEKLSELKMFQVRTRRFLYITDWIKISKVPRYKLGVARRVALVQRMVNEHYGDTSTKED